MYILKWTYLFTVQKMWNAWVGHRKIYETHANKKQKQKKKAAAAKETISENTLFYIPTKWLSWV